MKKRLRGMVRRAAAFGMSAGLLGGLVWGMAQVERSAQSAQMFSSGPMLHAGVTPSGFWECEFMGGILSLRLPIPGFLHGQDYEKGFY